MGFEPGECPARIAVAAWRIMGGLIDWAAVPVLANMYGIDDLEIFIAELVAIREHLNRGAREG